MNTTPIFPRLKPVDARPGPQTEHHGPATLQEVALVATLRVSVDNFCPEETLADFAVTKTSISLSFLKGLPTADQARLVAFNSTARDVLLNSLPDFDATQAPYATWGIQYVPVIHSLLDRGSSQHDPAKQGCTNLDRALKSALILVREVGSFAQSRLKYLDPSQGINDANVKDNAEVYFDASRLAGSQLQPMPPNALELNVRAMVEITRLHELHSRAVDEISHLQTLLGEVGKVVLDAACYVLDAMQGEMSATRNEIERIRADATGSHQRLQIRTQTLRTAHALHYSAYFTEAICRRNNSYARRHHESIALNAERTAR